MTPSLALPAVARDDWRRLGTRTTSGRIVLVSVTADATVYEHVPTADALAILRGSDSGADGTTDSPAGETTTPDVPVRSLFTVDLTFSPPLSTVGLDPEGALGTAAPKAKDRFVETLEADGIAVGDERFGEAVQRPDGTVGRLVVLPASYPLPASLAAGSDGDGGDDADPALSAEAHVAVWPTDDSYAMVGGVIPLEAPAALEADLNVAPDRDRTHLLEVIRSVSLESGSGGGESGPATEDRP